MTRDTTWKSRTSPAVVLGFELAAAEVFELMIAGQEKGFSAEAAFTAFYATDAAGLLREMRAADAVEALAWFGGEVDRQLRARQLSQGLAGTA